MTAGVVQGSATTTDVPARRIWLVADDYGISPAVSAAIRDLAARGRLSATSVMVAAPSFERAQAQSLAATGVAIGLHVTLTAPFRPLSQGFAPLRDGGQSLNLCRKSSTCAPVRPIFAPAPA